VFSTLKKTQRMMRAMCALCRILHNPVVYDICYLRGCVRRRVLRAWLADDGPRMSSHLGFTMYAMRS